MSNQKTLYLVRHCQATGQEAEAPLTKEGERQALLLNEFFEEIKLEAIYSSPYKRALQTCTPLAEQRGLPLVTDQRLVEKVLSSEPRENWLECLKLAFLDEQLSFEGGESNAEAQQRGLEVINEWLAKPKESPALMVTHGALLTLLLNAFDKSYGFQEWQALTNPDVFQCVFTIDEKNERDKVAVKRIWEYQK